MKRCINPSREFITEELSFCVVASEKPEETSQNEVSAEEA